MPAINPEALVIAFAGAFWNFVELSFAQKSRRKERGAEFVPFLVSAIDKKTLPRKKLMI